MSIKPKTGSVYRLVTSYVPTTSVKCLYTDLFYKNTHDKNTEARFAKR